MSFMQVVLVGNVGKDPELKYLESGMAVCNFSVAASVYRGKTKGNETEWWSVSVFGERAEWANQYLAKGTPVIVTSKDIHSDAYIGQDGQPKSNLKCVADSVNFCPSGGKSESNQNNAANSNKTSHNPPAKREEKKSEPEAEFDPFAEGAL